jgi:hypothetical protein
MATWQTLQDPPPANLCFYREATYGNRENHDRDARRREIGMQTRNEMCRVNEKGDN